MKRLVCMFSLLTAVAAGNVAHAAPITLDFDAAPADWLNSFTEEGFTLTTDVGVTLGYGGGAEFCGPPCSDNGTRSARLYERGLNATFELTEAAAGGFQFLGFDLGEGHMGLPHIDATSVTVTGYLNAALVASQTFLLDGINDGPGGLADFQSFLALGFTNVDRLVFEGTGGQQFFAMDNIVLDDVAIAAAAVPEPATLLMLSAGLIGLVAHARRRRTR